LPSGRGFHDADAVAFAVLDIGDGADVLDPVGRRMDSPPVRFGGGEHVLQRDDVDRADVAADARRAAFELVLALPQVTDDTGAIRRAGGDVVVVRRTPRLDGPPEHRLVERFRPLDVVAFDGEMADVLCRRVHACTWSR
jgi:hypothetical protein